LFDIHGNYTLAFEINMLVVACGIAALFFATMPAPPKAVLEAGVSID
jgi:hypothetical protein